MISNRLKTLTKYIESTDKLIDIGCDHALLDIYLIKNKLLDHLIVSDVHAQALESGKNNIKKEKLTKKIDCRLGDGLNVLTVNDDIDTILISGMGTSTIISILNSPYLVNINKLILQSNNDHYLLRSKLTSLGYYIDSEEYFIDNSKNYINIVFKKGKKRYNKKELLYGPILIKDRKYLEFELRNCVKIFNLLPKNQRKSIHKLKKEIKTINKLINKCD